MNLFSRRFVNGNCSFAAIQEHLVIGLSRLKLSDLTVNIVR